MDTTARRSGLPATTNVLILLCAMYFISYIVRQNVSTAIIAIRPEFKLSNEAAAMAEQKANQISQPQRQ